MIPESQLAHVGERVKLAIDWALLHIGVCEDPVGSNRGLEIDAWAKEFGSPLGSYWCALAVGKARKAGGLWIPTRDVGSCDEWYLQAEQAGKLLKEPCHGAAILYTTGKTLGPGRYAGRKDINHIGLAVRLTPKLFSVEGNTTLTGFDRNGYVMTLKECERARVQAYVAP